MKKEEFLTELRTRLAGLPKDDLDDRIIFYSEMIDDRIDEGKSEEEAIKELGGVDHIVNEIAKETPLVKLVKEKVAPKRQLATWEIILIVLGFPIWLPLLIVAAVLILVFYLLIWIFVIVFYIIEVSFIVASVGLLVAFFMYLFGGQFNLMMLGGSICCAGLAILFFFACIGITKATLSLSKVIMLGIKRAFIKKGRNEK